MRWVLPLLLLPCLAASQQAQTSRLVRTESVQAATESTFSIVPQISHRFITMPRRPENPLRPGIEDPEGPNNLTVGGLLGEERGSNLARYPGIGATGWTPPDPTGAAGPTYYVETVNSSIAFFTRAGVETFETDFGTFFASLSTGSFLFDPRVVYDWHAGRFVVCVLEEDDASKTSKVLLAISDDSDPNGTWHKYRLEAKNDLRYHAGTAVSGTSTTMVLDSAADSRDTFYSGCTVTILSGTGSGQSRTISSYAGATKTITVSAAWTTIPNATSTFKITQEDCWGDYPGLGYTKDGYGVSLNMFGLTSGSFRGVDILAIKKSSVLNGGTATVTTFSDIEDDSFTLQAAETLDASATKLFFVSSATTTKLKVWTLSGLGGTPVAPTTQYVTVPTFVWPAGSGVGSTSSHLLDELDGRMLNAQYQGGYLVSAHGVKVTGDDRMRMRWYEIAIPATGGTATLHQSGEVHETTAAEKHFIMGTIARAPTGDIAMIMTRCGPSGPVADIVRTMRKSTDALGTMGTPALITASGGATYGFAGYNRWGDYSSVSVDPLNQRIFWGTHMTGTAGTGWTTNFSTFALSTTTTPCVSGITLPTLYGGGAAGSATLTTSASATGAQTVTLSSSDTTAATVPASVSVAASATSASFTITPTSTGLDTAKTTVITAVLNGVAFSKLLTVSPAVLSSFTTALSSVNATATTTGTLTLTGKSGPSGRVVVVSSSVPTAAYPISGSITVASGTSVKNFTIYTNLVTVDTSATFTATLGGAKSKAITVLKPPTFTTFVVTPTTVTGGTSATVTATLDGVTAVSGLKVALSDSSAYASLPATATFPLGSDHVSATVTTTAPPSSRLVTITAKFNGVTKTATLTITP